MITQVLSGANALNASGSVNTARRGVTEGLFQVEITGTATVTLQGKLSSAAPWKTIQTFTASDAVVTALFPIMQALVSAYTSGVVNAWVEE